MNPSDPSEVFYRRVLEELLGAGTITRDASVLVVCGGPLDAHVLQKTGFTHVTISNLDERYNVGLQPFKWSKQDAEALTFMQGSFDWVIVHHGLHHCASPHKALIEMCRIARCGALVIEARDSLLIRLAAHLGFTRNYEFDAVMGSFDRGGLRNGPIPNYIYRWTEREARKTIESGFPHCLNDIRFFYGLRLPWIRLERGSPHKVAIARVLSALTRLLHRSFPSQCNEFAFAIVHRGFKPWIDPGRMMMRRDYDAGIDVAKMRLLNQRRLNHGRSVAAQSDANEGRHSDTGT